MLVWAGYVWLSDEIYEAYTGNKPVREKLFESDQKRRREVMAKATGRLTDEEKASRYVEMTKARLAGCELTVDSYTCRN